MRLPLLLTLIGLAVGQDERICDSRVNGLYEVEPCSPYYDHCYNGIAARKSCKDGLIFNPDSNLCDFDGNVKGCANLTKISCMNKKDGFYTIGCSSTYFQCVNGKIVNNQVVPCPNGLSYDSERNMCDYKWRVRACGGNPELESEQVTSPPLAFATQQPEVERTIYTAKIRGRGHHPRHSKPTTSCHGKPDGPHAVSSCSQQYITCANATSQLAECPEFQVFSSAERKCVPIETVHDCSGSSHASEIDCTFKEDGYYGLGCTSSFVFCSGGKALAMECPTSLVFNERKGYCDYQESCAGVSSPGAAAVVHTQPIAENSKSVSTSFCSLRKDGFYSEGCTSDFISCDHGHATSMKCPHDLVFNQERGYCDHRESCSEQHAKPSLTKDSISGSAAVESPGLTYSSHFEVTQKAELVSTIDCTGRRDGYYSEGCTPEFTFCNDGNATPLKCPSSLVFNMNKLRCDYVESCAAEAPGVTTSAPVRAPPGVTAVSCDGKEKGYYSNGCTPNYVFCNEGIATAMRCPSSLVFNQKKGLCDYPEECSGEINIPTAEALSQPQQHSTSLQSKTVVSSVNCEGKEDGYYSSGCTANFVFCNAGKATVMNCPTGLVFNEQKGNCDYPESCISEGAPPVLEKTASVVETAASVLTAAHESSIDCKTKANGYYALGCSSSYVHCHDGILTTLKCPSSLVYNEDEGICDYPEKSCTPNPHHTHVSPEVTVRHESVQVVATAKLEAAQVSLGDKLDCNGKKDGFYSRGCVKTYVYCENGSATTMNCPHTLVFNERKGRCDYLETCQTEVKTSLAIPSPFITPAPTVEIPKPAAQKSFECKGKSNGYYSLGCTPDYVACLEGVATAMMCPSNMVFNEKKVACDYLENCLKASIEPSLAVTATNSVQSVVQHTASQMTLEIDCVGKKDGYYSKGCSSTFVLCNEGVAVTMKCPPTLVFDEKKGHCDYLENCSKNLVGHSESVLPTESVASKTPMQPAPVPTPKPESVEPKSVLAHAKTHTIDVDCSGKKDGYYSSGCTPNFVFCSGGVGTTMSCPPSLVYNPQKGRCDYKESCSIKVEAQSSLEAVSPTVAQPLLTAPVPDAPPAVSQQKMFDCKGKMDGFYSSGCSSTFYFCNEGKATPMKCPSSLVFNAKTGHCDYVENCLVEAPAAPAKDASTSSSPPPAPSPAALSSSSQVNCAGKKDGYYSNGCTSEFVLCSEGTATTMKCPATLVFDEKKGHCDYLENCAQVPPTLAPAPVLPSPASAAPLVKETAEHAHSATTFPVNCAGKKDGYYSNGCSAEFVFCSEGMATVMKCPNTLVFNERKGFCDYVENCGKEGLKQSSMTTALPTVQRQSLKADKRMDCTGKTNGYYSNGCTAEFYLCSEGTVVSMKCPTPLVFDQKKGQCDYLEICNKGSSPLPLASTVSHKAQAPLVPDVVDCTGKPNGYYANGCSPSFAYCLDGVATPMRCPPSLVFNQNTGQCDFPERCSTKIPLPGMVSVPHQPPVPMAQQPAPLPVVQQPAAAPVVQQPAPAPVVQQPASAPVVQQPAPAPVVQQPAPAPVVQQPAHAVHQSTVVPTVQQAAHVTVGQHSASPTAPTALPQSASSFDCSGKVDGYYSNGCSPEFVFCAGGVATLMKCPASLVFNAKKGQCDYFENCSRMPTTPQTQPPRPVPTLSKLSTQSAAVGSLDCSGKIDGFYSHGCHSDFVQCSNGVAIKMKCPQPLVFNEKNGYCDYMENCSKSSKLDTQPLLSPSVTPARPEPTSIESRVECAGRSDGYHSSGCTSDFVYCHGGVATAMKCPASLVFNEEKGYCDYMENCKKTVPVATPTHVPPQSPPTVPLPTQQHAQWSSGVECAGRSDGYHSSGCTSDFVYCHGGVATAMKCPASLVFNEEKGYCDYMENCKKTVPVATPTHMPPQSPPAVPLPTQQHAQSPSGTVDCAGRPNGHYSKGCSNDFVICKDGVATTMKCPPMLVFNEINGYCDYPESCQSGGAAVVHKPPTTQQSPPPSSDLTCYNREDGYYSEGCSSEFVYCSEGKASYFKCPAGLVYDEKAGYCDYSEMCGGRSEAESVLNPSKDSTATLTSSADKHICKGRPDGYYSDGCSSEFIHCSDGVTTRLRCPSSLVFNQEMNYCDYPEVCSPQEEQRPSVAASPSKPQISFVCPESTGVFSLGCTSEFVVCSHDVAQVMTCPEGLVFNIAKGNCDYKEKCHEGKKDKTAADTPTPTVEPSTSRISSECKDLPDGMYGSHCGSSFAVCANGVAYTMNCPSDLVFDAKTNRCVFSKDCDEKSAGKKHGKATAALHSPQTTRDDCIGRPDGLHSLGCVGEFLQCVGGRTYSLHCPAGLVFVERLGVCDEPSTCKQLHRPKNVSSPLAYEPIVSSSPEDTECEAEGYFAHYCSVEFYNCVHGKLFAGKCPAGLVFNSDKSVCENVESCAGNTENKQRSSITLTVPKTEFSQDNSCKDRPDGVISDLDCQPHFTTCLAGTAFVTNCPAGLVYSVKAKLCDYPNVCGKEQHSSVAPVAEPTQTAAVHYQDTAVGKDLCAGKTSGPLEHSNCRSSFSFCVHGALYTMNCAPGLLFSFVSHRCEWPSMCNIAPKNTEPVVPPSTQKVVITTSRDFLKAEHCTDYDCTSLPDGNYQIGECVGRFVMCSNGRAYVQFCPSGLVYNPGKGLCDYECGSQVAASPTEEKCVSNQALRPCSPKFRRCSNGKLVPAQCPGSSTFNEALSLCVYDQPECLQEAPVSHPLEYEPAYQIPHAHPLPTSFTPVVSPVASHSPYLPVQPSYVHPFPQQIQFLPMTVSDDFYRRDKINKGKIPFEKRSMIADRHRHHHVKDVFDGHASPYLIRGIDRIFVPYYKKHRKHGRNRDRSDCGDSQDCSDEQDVNVRRLFGNDLHNVELPVPIEVRNRNQEQTATTTSSTTTTQKSSTPKIKSAARNAVVKETLSNAGAVNAQSPLQGVSHKNENDEVEDIAEASGEEVLTRRKRSSTITHKTKHDYSMCTAKSTSEFVSLGNCHQDFIICRAAGAGLRAACPIGDLFDAQLNKCVSSQFCGEDASYDEPLLQEQKKQVKQDITASTTAPRPRKPPVYRPRKRLGHPAHHKTTTHSLLEHSRPIPVHPVPIPKPHPVAHTTASPSPSLSEAQLPYDCSTNVDYALDCSGNYVRCANGIAYRMKCPQGLVFDQTRQYCDYPQHVAGCSTSQAPTLLPQPKPYPYRPEEEEPKLVRPALQSAPLPHTANRLDLCASSPDGLLGEGCTASFIICAGGRMQASMNCPAGTFFDATRKTCDFKERVVACGGSLDEPTPSVHSPVVARTTTPASVHAHSCAAPLQPLGRCSSKFVVCSDGKLSEFHCSNPLVFNPLTITCDFREFVSECAEYKGADAPTTQVVTTTVQTTTTTEPPKCVFNEKRQTFALDYCARKYGLCSKRGVLERAECTVGFLFDAHLNTCVPAEQCGQRKLEAVLSKVTIAPPKAAALVDNAESKVIHKKDERCRGSADGTTKSLGRCRSTYLRCVGGEAHIEPCPAGEVFCAVSNACVSRATAPECHTQQKMVHTYASASVESSSDLSMFCEVRSDGLYRNPSDCTGILQCFGGDVYEYPPCSSGLVFNEAKSKCDYRDAVPECKSSSAVADEMKGCRGANHGELIPHESNCQYFYRCSWNHLEKMHCPSGTVFNPDFSVCDYPANVPQCAKRR